MWLYLYGAISNLPVRLSTLSWVISPNIDVQYRPRSLITRCPAAHQPPNLLKINGFLIYQELASVLLSHFIENLQHPERKLYLDVFDLEILSCRTNWNDG